MAQHLGDIAQTVDHQAPTVDGQLRAKLDELGAEVDQWRAGLCRCNRAEN
ncbi:hypothetical protein [Kibdelosporangium phytohabitans]|nr:hypothetical protein [Kibdelosporangium phytohabitans]MBE1467435.1 hypothetical protein [Kibdelosporangium phytohabitans]